jgi:hypothetical protein
MSYEDCQENAQYEVAKIVTRPRLVPLRLLVLPVTGNFLLASEFKWHRHSCLCAVAKPRTRRMANAAASLSAKIPWPPWRLIANLELRLRLTHRKMSLLRIPNRKKTRVLRAPRRIAASLCARIRIVNRDAISNRDTAIRISPNPYHYSEFEISNRDKMRVLCPPSRGHFSTFAEHRRAQLKPYVQSRHQIDPAFARAYTYIPPKEKPSWKIPSY